MNTISTDLKYLIDRDINPLIIFDSNAKIHYINSAAELLITPSTQKEIYELSISHAPKSFGSKITHLELSYKTFKFYAINVIYENEDELVVWLYHKPMPIQESLTLDGYVPSDINLLLETNLELFKMDYKGKLSLFTDYDLPMVHLNQNRFSQLLQKVFNTYKISKKLDIALTIKIGESIYIENNRYSILLLKVKGDSRTRESDKEIETLSEQNHINLILDENKIYLKIPFITDKKS